MKRDKLNAYIKKSNRPDSKYPPLRMEKKNSGLGCGGWLVFIFIVIAAIYIFGSCDNSKSDSDPSGRSRYSSSYSSSRSSPTYSGTPSSGRSYKGSTGKPSSGSGSKTKSSSDPYDAKSYAHADDFYYDYYDNFWDYEDAEDYWGEHQE